MAGGLGFEPRLTESESAVLPLNYPPPSRAIADKPFSIRFQADRRVGLAVVSANFGVIAFDRNAAD